MPKMINRNLLALSLLFFLSPNLWAQEQAPLSALTILEASQKSIYAVEDQTSNLTFRIIDATGKESKSTYKFYWKNYDAQFGINSKSLFVAESPMKDRGKKFLVWEYEEEGKADQWMYLPELRQVRRVQPGRHLHHGEPESELAIEDVRRRRNEIDDHHRLPDAEIRGVPVYVIESRHNPESQYGKINSYISKKDGTTLKIEFFSKEDNLIKTQLIEWERVDDIWVWKKSETVNAVTFRKTIVTLSHTKVNADLRDDQFSERALRR